MSVTRDLTRDEPRCGRVNVLDVTRVRLPRQFIIRTSHDRTTPIGGSVERQKSNNSPAAAVRQCTVCRRRHGATIPRGKSVIRWDNVDSRAAAVPDHTYIIDQNKMAAQCGRFLLAVPPSTDADRRFHFETLCRFHEFIVSSSILVLRFHLEVEL
ncbi:hypothetical protein J6590_039871 [Homalodisca vitripennis]|nr:hypothetical protein J6590_039871 [Homalodisca vitripennis]